MKLIPSIRRWERRLREDRVVENAGKSVSIGGNHSILFEDGPPCPTCGGPAEEIRMEIYEPEDVPLCGGAVLVKPASFVTGIRVKPCDHLAMQVEYRMKPVAVGWRLWRRGKDYRVDWILR